MQCSFPSDPSLIAFLTSRQKKTTSESMDTGTTLDGNNGDCHSNITSCTNEKESSHVDKHVHFSEDVQIITQENQQKMMAQEQQEESDGCITIGDLKVSSKWLHMGTVETEKLEWMKDCPSPSAVDRKVLKIIINDTYLAFIV